MASSATYTLPATTGTLLHTGAGFTIPSGNITLTSGTFNSTALGSLSACAYSLGSTTNCGIYGSAADRINFVTAGVSRMQVSSTNITFGIPFRGANGSVSSPTYSFSSSSTSGLYSNATDEVSISAGSTLMQTWNSISTTVAGILSVTGLSTFNGGARVGTNGTLRTLIVTGSGTTSGVVTASFGNRTVAISFGTTFSSTPNVIISITNGTVGSNANACIACASSITTSGFTAVITNIFTSDTTGNVSFAWQAWN